MLNLISKVKWPARVTESSHANEMYVAQIVENQITSTDRVHLVVVEKRMQLARRSFGAARAALTPSCSREKADCLMIFGLA